jgi:hypothetical protein
VDVTGFSLQPGFSNPTDQPRTSIGAAARGGAVSGAVARLPTLYADLSVFMMTFLVPATASMEHRCCYNRIDVPPMRFGAGDPPP